MPAKTGSRNGLSYGWALGENNWNTGMDGNLTFIDRFGVHLSFKSFLNTPPGSPAAGDCHVIDTVPTGVWVGKAGQVAVYDDGAWRYGVPRTGWRAYCEADEQMYVYDGGWAPTAGSGTVTTVSVDSSNGFSGSVANPTTTPAITLSTGVTGLLKGAAGALVAATNADLPAMSATVGGAVPTPPNDPAKFLNGQGAFVVPSAMSGSANWGAIGGTLSSQTDLQAALDLKANSSAVPAQVNLTQGTNVTITGTYPNLTISSAAIPAQFNPIAGTNVTLTGTYPNITFNASTSGGSMTYPSGSGIPVVAAGSSWGTTVAAPSGGIVGSTDAQTLTNKRVTARVGSTTSSATPTINTDLYDVYKLTAQAVNITSFTTNLTGTPADGDILIIEITGTAARAITWGASFEASTVALPTTTVSTNMLAVAFMWNAVTSKWRCMGAV